MYWNVRFLKKELQCLVHVQEPPESKFNYIEYEHQTVMPKKKTGAKGRMRQHENNITAHLIHATLVHLPTHTYNFSTTPSHQKHAPPPPPPSPPPPTHKHAELKTINYPKQSRYRFGLCLYMYAACTLS